MKVVRIIMHTPTSATAYLEPSWWERLFGVVPVVCDLVREKDDDEQGALLWRSLHTGERLGYMRWGSKIQQALAFQPQGDTPNARIVQTDDAKQT